jgi:NhaA family Na+:H+ antiporter
MTVLAGVLSNSPVGTQFAALWEIPLGWNAGGASFQLPLRLDRRRAVDLFFLVVGLEIKREFTVGRLATRRAAALPFAAALGAMLLPAGFYLLAVPGSLVAGWAIPTTTDTALRSPLSRFSARVPVELRIFLTAAVIVDDLVAIAIVAVFYSSGSTLILWLPRPP